MINDTLSKQGSPRPIGIFVQTQVITPPIESLSYLTIFISSII